MSPTALPVASAPVSFGVDEIIAGDAWMPEPEQMLDWMVDIGYEGTELGPPGFLGDAPTLHERLTSRGLQLVGAFLPQRFSRSEHVAEDQAWLRRSLALIREGAPAGSRTFAVLSDGFDEPDRHQPGVIRPRVGETFADHFSHILDHTTVGSPSVQD